MRTVLPVYMEQNGWGVVLLVLSLMLTRSVHVVKSDMDEPSNSLMGMHGYCTQELVNLIIIGGSCVTPRVVSITAQRVLK